MNINQDLCANALRKVALLITKAADLGMNLSSYGEAAENPNSGNVYLWLEDYPFCLFISLGSDEIYANWSSPIDGEENDTAVGNHTLYSLCEWANELTDIANEAEGE
jgi:hypothetical protein